MTQGDRALDKRIAEDVFGYEVVPCTDTIHAAGVKCPVLRFNARDEDGYLSSQPAVPPYSSDIAAAYRVLVEMTGRDERVGSLFYQALRRCALEVAAHNPFSGWLKLADRHPEMICKAALAAVAVAGTAALSAAADGQGREVKP